MRESKPGLTAELDKHRADAPIWKASAYPVKTFRALVEHVARLAHANPDDLLFFRGQGRDYESKSGGTTLYPSIYRGDSLATRELRHRFDVLEQAGRLLAERFRTEKIDGYRDVRLKKYIQWSILQHYEVVATPLLDLTQSLRVASSFAQMTSSESSCYVYVFGLPYLTNRISINSEHDLVNVRLLSICPPAALRPYFQEGYVAGTADVTDDFDSKTELDFRNRLVAKFSIPRAKAFWGSGFDPIPESALYPKGDAILELCSGLRAEVAEALQPGKLGEFVQEWAMVEDYLLETARRYTGRNVSVREAIATLARQGRLGEQQAMVLDSLRKFRNAVVHKPSTITNDSIEPWLEIIHNHWRSLKRPVNHPE